MADVTDGDEAQHGPGLIDLTEAARPATLQAALASRADELLAAAHAHGGNDAMSSLRTATHQGHRIEVRTTYEISIDGQPLDTHVSVQNGGRVHYHGLPTRDFASTVDLVKAIIDQFPSDPDLATAPGDPDADPDGGLDHSSHEHDHGEHGEHGDHGEHGEHGDHGEHGEAGGAA